MSSQTKWHLPFTLMILCVLTVFVIGFFVPPDIYWDFLYFPVIILSLLYLKRDLTVAIFILCFVFFLARQWRLPHDLDHNWFNLVFNIVLVGTACLSVLYVVVVLNNYSKDNQDEKSRLLTIINNATIGIIITDANGEIVLMNPFITDQFGYEEHELVGQTVEILLPEGFRSKHKNQRMGFQHAPRNRAMGRGMNLLAQHKSRGSFPVEISLGHYYVKKNLFVIAFINDITQRVEIEKKILDQNDTLSQITEALKLANSQLELRVTERTEALHETVKKLLESNSTLEKEIQERIKVQDQLTQKQHELSEALIKEKELGELKSRFVSMASHEFRTPLSAILSSASLIGKYTHADQQPQREKHITKIKTSINLLTGILNDFLSHSKIEEGRINVAKEPININSFLENVSAEMQGILKAGQWIDMQFEIRNSMVYTDPKLLHAICTNLLGNAVKYSPEDMPIQFFVEEEDGILTIKIIDKGIGIPQSDQKHLFERFFRAHNAINIQGTGLGLSIVKSYVELLGGDIRFNSVENLGSEFVVTIPI